MGFLDNFVYHDYDRAYNVYSIYIRDYMSLFFVVLSLLLFAIILRFYLNEFSKYFKEINRSIDTAEPVTKEYSIYNSSVTYVRQNGKIFQMAEVCRTETDTISGKTMKHLLYTNKCEITYLLPEGMEVQEK